MTKAPTLQVSADMLVSQSRALPPGPPLWVTEREVPLRLRPALTLDKPRIGGGSGPNLSPVPKNLEHVCRPWWPFACPMGEEEEERLYLHLETREGGGGGGGEALFASRNTLKRHARTLSGDATGLPLLARKSR